MENGSSTLPLYAARALLFAGSAYAVQFTDLHQRIGANGVAVLALALSDGEARWRSQMGARAMDLWSGALFGWSALQVYQSVSSLCSGLSLAESLESINHLTFWTAFGLGFSKGIWQFTTDLDEGKEESLYLRGLVRGFCTSLFTIPRPSRFQTSWGQRIRGYGRALYHRLFSPPASSGSSESWLFDAGTRGHEEESNPGSSLREFSRWLTTRPDKKRVVELIQTTHPELLPLSSLSEMGPLESEALESYLDEVAPILEVQDLGSDDEIIAEIQSYYGEGVPYTSERVAQLKKWYQSRLELPSRASQVIQRIGDGAEGRALLLIQALSTYSDNPLPKQNPPIDQRLDTLSSRIATGSQPNDAIEPQLGESEEELDELELYNYLTHLKPAHYTRLHDALGIDPETDGLIESIKTCGLNSKTALKAAGITQNLTADQCVDRIIAKIRESSPQKSQESSFKRSLESLTAAAARIGQANLAIQAHHALSLLIILTPILNDPKTYLVMAGVGLFIGREFNRGNSQIFGLPIGREFQQRGEEFARHNLFGRLRLLYTDVTIANLVHHLFLSREVVQGFRLGLLARWLLPL